MNTQKCEKCFWKDVTKENWTSFNGSSEKLTVIRNFKCKECRSSNKDNFLPIWSCKKCKTRIEGHNYYLHASLCDECFNNLTDEEADLYIYSEQELEDDS